MSNNYPDPKKKGSNQEGLKESYSHDRPDPKTPRPKLPRIEINQESGKTRTDK